MKILVYYLSIPLIKPLDEVQQLLDAKKQQLFDTLGSNIKILMMRTMEQDDRVETLEVDTIQTTYTSGLFATTTWPHTYPYTTTGGTCTTTGGDPTYHWPPKEPTTDTANNVVSFTKS